MEERETESKGRGHYIEDRAMDEWGGLELRWIKTLDGERQATKPNLHTEMDLKAGDHWRFYNFNFFADVVVGDRSATDCTQKVQAQSPSLLEYPLPGSGFRTQL